METAWWYACLIVSLLPRWASGEIDKGYSVCDLRLSHYKESAASEEDHLVGRHDCALTFSKRLQSLHMLLLHPFILRTVIVAQRRRLSSSKKKRSASHHDAHRIKIDKRLPCQSVILIDSIVDLNSHADSSLHLFSTFFSLLYLFFHGKWLQLSKPIDSSFSLACLSLLAVVSDAGILIFIEEYLCFYHFAQVAWARSHVFQGMQNLIDSSAIDTPKWGKALKIFLEMYKCSRWFPLLRGRPSDFRKQPASELTATGL